MVLVYFPLFILPLSARTGGYLEADCASSNYILLSLQSTTKSDILSIDSPDARA